MLRSTSAAGSSSVPRIIYGTAWKKERTADLVQLAIRKGFRAIDTACQPKHYNEAGVGEGIQRAYQEGIVRRENLFIQTKFTSLSGQDPKNIPYDPLAPLPEQVKQSLNVSLRNLGTDYLDSLVLHSPMHLFEDTMAVWRELEGFVRQGYVRHIGISNTYNIETLKELFGLAEIKPSFVQNRFYEQSGYDVEIREFCRINDMKYQSFWTLTANPKILRGRAMTGLVEKYPLFTPAQLFYKYVQQLGIIPLSGTTSETHMEQDLSLDTIPDFSADDLNSLNAELFYH